MKLFCILALLVSILLVTDANSHLRSLSLHAADDSSVGNQIRNLAPIPIPPIGSIVSSLRNQGYDAVAIIGFTAIGAVVFYSMYYWLQLVPTKVNRPLLLVLEKNLEQEQE